MKQDSERFVVAVVLGCALTIVVAGSAFAKPAKDAADRFGRHGEAPPVPYAGDCNAPYPPGYRQDLRGWRSGFNRDFSCYMLDEQ